MDSSKKHIEDIENIEKCDINLNLDIFIHNHSYIYIYILYLYIYIEHIQKHYWKQHIEHVVVHVVNRN